MKIKTNFPNILVPNQDMEYYKDFLNRSFSPIHHVIDLQPMQIANNRIIKGTNKITHIHGSISHGQVQETFYPIETISDTQPALDETQIKILCAEELEKFTNYARKILEKKGIAIVKIKTREWQSIEDNDLKQCILEFDLHTDSKTALAVWDELSEELETFINLEHEDFLSFLKERLTLEVVWR